MPAPDAIAQVVWEWTERADHDLLAASQILKLGAASPAETVCFHVQQCIEKYLKAALASMQEKVPKTHEIEILVSLLPEHLRPDLSIELQKELTSFAVGPRYPFARVPSVSEARTMVALARRVRAEVRRKLPKAALRRPRRKAK